MIRKFDSRPLRVLGYLGSLLRDHNAEEKARYTKRQAEKGNRVMAWAGTNKKFPYFWARCDWCGEIAVLDDEGEEQPHLKFEELLGWTSYLPVPGGKLRHFCTRKCRAAFIDRCGSAVH